LRSDISVYSLVAVARAAAPLMTSGGGIVTMTYYGAKKLCAEVQRDGRGQGGAGSEHAVFGIRPWAEGIRVNAISAGPIKTLAARAVAGLGDMLIAHCRPRTPEAQCGPRRSWRNCCVPAFRRWFGHHRRNDFTFDCGYNIMGF